MAEIYESDKDYPYGTVLEVGDTGVTEFKGGSLCGVVSKAPGLLINAQGKGVMVALKGKVQVLSIGCISAGQYCIAKDGRVYGVDKNHMTFALSLDCVGIALSDTVNGYTEVKV